MTKNIASWTESSKGAWEIPIPSRYSRDFNNPASRLKVNQLSVKTGHKTRTIFAPDHLSKIFYRELLSELYTIFSDIETQVVAFGFIPNRSVVDQAKCHIDYKYTISLDIRDFFDSIKPKLVEGLIPDEMIPILFINGAPRQGLPTSPIVANIAFDKIDKEIIAFLSSITELSRRQNWQFSIDSFTYTRYADDLSISLHDKSLINRIIRGIQIILMMYGFELHPNKTKVLYAHNGRRVICGVGVDEDNVYPTRKALKKIRAATHQSNLSSLLGLQSWVSSIQKKQSK